MARIIYKEGLEGQNRLECIEGIEIDKLAREIDGADLLEDFSSSVWSCSRCNPDDGWIANGNGDYAYGNYLNFRYVAAPIVLLDTAADGVA